MGRLTFHNLNHSQSQRIFWLLEELNIDYDVVNHYRKPDYLAPDSIKDVSPTGSAPAMTLPDGRKIAECQAMATYLLRTYDTEGRFSAGSQTDEAKFDWVRDEMLTSWVGTTFGFMVPFHFILSIVPAMSPWFIRPLMWIATYPIIKGLTGPGVKRMLKWLEEQLGKEDYLMGKEPGRCDFLVSYPLDVISQRKIADMTEFPWLSAYMERYQARPAWKRSLAKGNGYDWTVF